MTWERWVEQREAKILGEWLGENVIVSVNHGPWAALTVEKAWGCDQREAAVRTGDRDGTRENDEAHPRKVAKL